MNINDHYDRTLNVITKYFDLLSQRHNPNSKIENLKMIKFGYLFLRKLYH